MEPETHNGRPAPASVVVAPPGLSQVATLRNSDDEWRPLAWVTSICILFLIIGVLGLKPRMIKQATAIERTQVVPIVFTPPAPPQKQEPVTINKTKPRATAPEPAVPAIAASNPAQVAFPVPVQSPRAIVTPGFAPPPQIETKPTAPVVTEFNPDSATHGYFPKPKYPAGELAARHQGRVMLSIVVGGNGKPQSVAVKESSGWPRLDNAALEKARKDWDFGPGPIRYFYAPVVFHIQ